MGGWVGVFCSGGQVEGLTFSDVWDFHKRKNREINENSLAKILIIIKAGCWVCGIQYTLLLSSFSIIKKVA